MIILFGGSKGGPGKSTAALNVGVALSSTGASVLFIDGDKQRSLAKWHARRVEAGHTPQMTLIEKRGSLLAVLKDLSGSYDYVLVDVAGDDNQEMRTAMTIADELVIVLRPSQFDAETLEEFSEVITAAQNFNPELRVRALFSQVPTNNNESETEDVADFVSEFPEVTAMKTTIGYRKIFRDSVTDGRGVLEMPSKSTSEATAKLEVRDLVKELMN